jgi:hypothetical protein
MQAKEAISLLQQLADQSSVYKNVFEQLIIPAVKQLEPTQEIDNSFFFDKPVPQFKHLAHLGTIDWFSVVIDANEWIIEQNKQAGLKEEVPLTIKVREWMAYRVTRTLPLTDQANPGQ